MTSFLLLIFYITISVHSGSGGYASSVNLPNIQTSLESNNGNSGSTSNNGECRDYTGKVVLHAMHFVPMGMDSCKLCICENGHPKNCRGVLCSPPPECKSFQMGASCCEFVCLDDLEPSTNSENTNGFSTYFDFNSNRNRLLILASALTPTFVIMCCLVRCCYRKHRERVREIETEQTSSLERDGLVHFNAFMKICDKTGKKLKSGEIGEIYMKFEFGFLKCYNELPEAMRNTMDVEGFYRTGDIGYFKRGVVYILDKNRYISDRRNSNMRCSRF